MIVLAFYLIFLMKITNYLGFYPDCTNMHYNYFNLEEGLFENSKNSKYAISGDSLSFIQNNFRHKI